MKRPGNPAIIINMAFLKTCPYNTLLSERPFALAVVTYCFFISSTKEFFVNKVRVAKEAIEGKGPVQSQSLKEDITRGRYRFLNDKEVAMLKMI